MLADILRPMIRYGHLVVTVGSDKPVGVGLPGSSPDLSIRISDHRTAARIALDPDLGLGEAYMDGHLVIENGTLWDLMVIIGRNISRKPNGGFVTRIRGRLSNLFRKANSPERSQSNVAHHYDLSEEFYRLFLDADMQYSCAYFPTLDTSLDEAQIRKKAHILSKLDLRDGQRILDIGCGWGGMALSLAQAADVDVTGITLSIEQLRVAEGRAQTAGLGDRVRFELADYRSLRTRFDRIVSVGMLEHVGQENLSDYFSQVSSLLEPDGVALIHGIGRNSPGTGRNPWIEKHIFPGGYIPSLSQTVNAIEGEGLWVTDVEVLRLHYAQTLRHWRMRAEQHRAQIEELYDARFYRMWEFYLAGCEMAFRFDGLMVVQIQLSPDIAAVPLTRDYMGSREKQLLKGIGDTIPTRGRSHAVHGDFGQMETALNPDEFVRC